ncbi:hypothetical protein H0R92_06460 [Treponema sp. OMZ 840]|uniref:hypothetical protein n=1 Tax=Treponema sp. OMZ 840 TaxID=244313 RepID=UPI003D8EF29E
MNRNLHYTIEVFSYVCALFLLLSYPVRAKLLIKQAGTLLLPLTRRSNKLYIFAAVAAFIMLAVLHWREFTLAVTLILYATALLAVELAVRDTLYKRTAGVYEHLIIVDSRKIRIKDIISVAPPMHKAGFEDTDKAENTDRTEDTAENRVLKFTSEKSGEIFVGFENTGERNAALHLLKKRLAQKGANC